MDQIVRKDRNRIAKLLNGGQPVHVPLDGEQDQELINNILSRLGTSDSSPLAINERKVVYLLASTLVDLLGFDKTDNPTAYYAAKLHLDNIIHFIYSNCREFLSIPSILAIACFESDKVNTMLSLSGNTQGQALALQHCFEVGDIKGLIAQGEERDRLLCDANFAGCSVPESKKQINPLLTQCVPLFKNRTFLANMGNFNKSKCSLNTLFFEKIIKLLCLPELTQVQQPNDINSPAINQMFNDCLNLVARCARSAMVYNKPVSYPVFPLSIAKASVGRKRIKSTL